MTYSPVTSFSSTFTLTFCVVKQSKKSECFPLLPPPPHIVLEIHYQIVKISKGRQSRDIIDNSRCSFSKKKLLTNRLNRVIENRVT